MECIDNSFSSNTFYAKLKYISVFIFVFFVNPLTLNPITIKGFTKNTTEDTKNTKREVVYYFSPGMAWNLTILCLMGFNDCRYS